VAGYFEQKINWSRFNCSQIIQIFADMNSQKSVFICEISEKHNEAFGDAALISSAQHSLLFTPMTIG
jgi:hypothetical protein